MTTQTPVAATDLTPKQEQFALAYAGHGNAARAYREAFDCSPDTSPKTVRNRGYELVHTPAVVARVREVQDAAARNVVLNAESMMRHLYEIGYEAQPDDISSVRAVPCRRCYGIGHGHQWVDATEWALAAAHALDNRLPVPGNEGGYGYSKVREPHESCPECLGAGRPVVTVADTTGLMGASRKLFVAARQKANGEVEIELEDRHAARQELHRMLGLITNKSESKNLNVSASLGDVDTSPEALLLAFNKSRVVNP